MTESDSSSDVTDAPRSTKVGRLIGEHDLGDVGAELERRWTRRDGQRDSLRTLAEVFNRRILEAAMVGAGMDLLEGEVENIYRLLTDEDVSEGNRTETEARLRRAGVDVDALRGDFVTYQAVRTYLKDVRNASYSSDSRTTVEGIKASFDRLVGRTTAVVEQKLNQVRATDQFTLGEFRVTTTVNVYCEDCQTQYEVSSLLRQGGCNCRTDDE